MKRNPQKTHRKSSRLHLNKIQTIGTPRIIADERLTSYSKHVIATLDHTDPPMPKDRVEMSKPTRTSLTNDIGQIVPSTHLSVSVSPNPRGLSRAAPATLRAISDLRVEHTNIQNHSLHLSSRNSRHACFPINRREGGEANKFSLSSLERKKKIKSPAIVCDGVLFGLVEWCREICGGKIRRCDR